MIAHWENFLGILVLAIILFSNINLGGKIPKLTCPNRGRLLLKETQKCYPPEEKGPCGEEMVVRPSDEDERIGVCKCDTRECYGNRPKIFFHEYSRCFSFFDQGPCEEGEWLVPLEDEHGSSAKCQVIPCPERYQEHLANVTDFRKQSSKAHAFVFEYGGQCYNVVEAQKNLCPGGGGYFGDKEGKFELICYFGGRSCGATHGNFNNCEDGTIPDDHGGCEPRAKFE